LSILDDRVVTIGWPRPWVCSVTPTAEWRQRGVEFYVHTEPRHIGAARFLMVCWQGPKDHDDDFPPVELPWPSLTRRVWGERWTKNLKVSSDEVDVWFGRGLDRLEL
jgi:hypothetical protein